MIIAVDDEGRTEFSSSKKRSSKSVEKSSRIKVNALANKSHNLNDRTIVLEPPTLDNWPKPALKAPINTLYTAQAYYLRSDIYSSPSSKASVIGYARRSEKLPVRARAYGKGCKHGKWYALSEGGYVCTKKGFYVAKAHKKMDLYYVKAKRNSFLPFRYGKVINRDAFRFYRIPTRAELKTLNDTEEEEKKWPEVVERKLEGAFFIAYNSLIEDKLGSFYQTVLGRVVREDAVETLQIPPTRGVQLGKRLKLPIAFVFEKDRPLYKIDEGELEKIGIAKKHARLPVVKKLSLKGERFVLSKKNFAIKRKHVRIVKKIKRSTRIPAAKKWIHVDLSEQTLVAYRGNKPVFATVISGGVEGHEAPTGIFRIAKKHISFTMDGPDEKAGWYEVEEVPWTMYYWKGYALHGAYWHNDFGKSRSHGCTNLAPADARWLFNWVDPKLPANWHGIIQTGTWVAVTS